MKKLFFAAIILSFVASMAMAQEAMEDPSMEASKEEAMILTLKGDIIDNMCADANKAGGLREFVKTHTKECAVMPACAASGYSIFADGVLMKLDAASNAKVAEFLKDPQSKLQVVVEAKKLDNELSLMSIKNQE